MVPNRRRESTGVSWIMWSFGALALVACFVVPTSVQAEPKWMLIYYRQIGNHVNEGALTMETHVFHENGTKAANVGITNASTPGSAIFGQTDSNGYNRVTFDDNNCAYDVTIYDPVVAKDYSPTFRWQNPLGPVVHYSYVTHWLRVSDDSVVDAFPAEPVYHYDLVDGLNQASGYNPGCEPTGWVEAPGANSDERELFGGGWATYQAQTFVVPAGVNRIISAQAWLTRGFGDPPFYYYASIHEGSATGPRIGPRLTSQLHHSVNFKEESVLWGINDVPVTPGQTYALKLEPTDGQGCNVYSTANDNYPNGSLYNGTTQVPGSDMIAVVVGVGLDVTPPTISRSPVSFSHTLTKGQPLANDTFNVSNSGGGLLEYSISDNADWLTVNPASGDSAGETDPITITYATPPLSVGPHSATITIADPDATNNPQTISVNLTIEPREFAPCDFDQDYDVDQVDYGPFQACFSGTGLYHGGGICAGADLDLDNDVDQDDLGKFLDCASGASVPADPACAD